MTPDTPPLPSEDWISQRQLAKLLGISERTASVWASEGRLRRFEHGVKDCGRRRYSRALVKRELHNRWQEAVLRQDGDDGQ
jgi:predicted site-specific integrase-resolvase